MSVEELVDALLTHPPGAQVTAFEVYGKSGIVIKDSSGHVDMLILNVEVA